MKKFFVFSVLFITLTLVSSVDAENISFQALRIAHAGGGLGKATYTNSYQALNANIVNGFRYFEIDFTFTSDGHLVCLHDWKVNFKRTFGFESDRRLSLEEFENLTAKNTKFTNCTLEGLAVWMQKNPMAFIVTDVRGDNLKALKQIHDILPDADNRVIPQIYRPENFEAINKMGFQQIIWTLYRYSGSAYKVLEWVSGWKAKVAVAMPKEIAATNFPRELSARGVTTYVHTVNKIEEMNSFMVDFGITEIYTDYLVP